MKINPFSKAKETKAGSSKPEKADAKATKSKDDQRNDGEKLAVKDVSSAIPEYQTVKMTADLDRVFISKDKKQEKKIAAAAKKILKKINFDAKVPADNFIEAHIAGPGADVATGGAELVVNMTGKVAVERFFKAGLSNKLFGWIPRLFGGANKSLGYKWLKANSGFNLYDPKKKHSHLEDPKRVKEMLESSRYAVSVVYKANADGSFSKEPEALVLVDRMIEVTKQIKENMKGASEAMRKEFDAIAEKLKDEKLNTFHMINTLMINPSRMSEYENGSKNMLLRESLLSSVIESFDKHSSFIVPGEIFMPEDAKTNKYQYDQVNDLHFLDMDVKKGVIGHFKTKGTVVRNLKLYPDKVPEEDLATLMSKALMMEHTKNSAKLNKGLQNRLQEVYQQVTEGNEKAFAEYNKKIAA